MDEGLVLVAAAHADGVGVPLAHPDPELPELLLAQDPRSVLVEGVNILQEISKKSRCFPLHQLYHISAKYSPLPHRSLLAARYRLCSEWRTWCCPSPR